MEKCMICNVKKNNLRKCVQCNKIFCIECLLDYYDKNTPNCPICGTSQNIDEYEPILSTLSHININSNYFDDDFENDFDDNFDNDFNDEINSQQFCLECQRIFEENNSNTHLNHHFISLNQMTFYNLNKVSNDLKQLNEFKKEIELLFKDFDYQSKINQNMERFQLEQIDKLKENINHFYEKNNSILNENKQKLKEIYEKYRNINSIIENFKNYVNQNLTDSISSEVENINNQLEYLRKDQKEVLDIKNKIFNNKPFNFKFFFHDIIINKQLNLRDNNTCLQNMNYSSNTDFNDENVALFISPLNENQIIIKVDIKTNQNNKNGIYEIYFHAHNFRINKILNIPLKLAFKEKKSISFQKILDKNNICDFFQNCEDVKFNFFITKLFINQFSF